MSLVAKTPYAMAVLAAYTLTGCTSPPAPLHVQLIIVGVIMWAISVVRCPAH